MKRNQRQRIKNTKNRIKDKIENQKKDQTNDEE